MHLVDIANYHALLELHPDDLLSLAQACHLAAVASTLPDLPAEFAQAAARTETWEALALFFEATALASTTAAPHTLQELRARHARRVQLAEEAAPYDASPVPTPLLDALDRATAVLREGLGALECGGMLSLLGDGAAA